MAKVQKKPNNQYVVTIDKGLADAMDLDGEEIQYEVKSQNRIEMKIVRE